MRIYHFHLEYYQEMKSCVFAKCFSLLSPFVSESKVIWIFILNGYSFEYTKIGIFKMVDSNIIRLVDSDNDKLVDSDSDKCRKWKIHKSGHS